MLRENSQNRDSRAATSYFGRQAKVCSSGEREVSIRVFAVREKMGAKNFCLTTIIVLEIKDFEKVAIPKLTSARLGVCLLTLNFLSELCEQRTKEILRGLVRFCSANFPIPPDIFTSFTVFAIGLFAMTQTGNE